MMNNSSKIATSFDTILRIFLILIKVIINLDNYTYPFTKVCIKT